MADETTDIQQQTEEVTPQQQGIQFEDILPWGTTGGDTGLSSRLKLKRNFEKIKAWMDSHGLLDDKYLSRQNDDTARGLIGFLEGIWIKAQELFYFDKDGNIRCNDVSALGNVIVNEMLSAKDIIFRNTLKSDEARNGFTDGKGIWMDALQGLIQTDGLEVRGFMRVMELIINRLQLMESDYSFTEGDTVERIDYEDSGQTLVLTMRKDHDNDYTPFYPGDIIYGIRNDLLPKDAAEQMAEQGHTVTRNGSYFRTWMRVKSVDISKNQLRVALYQGQLPGGEAVVPGGSNFSPWGTRILDDVTAPMLAEYNTIPEGATQSLGETGYDTMLTVTRHGNVADGIDPETGRRDEHVYQSQLGRQQAWVLSTTDKRLSMFWNVDEPVIRDENYALCLGILPDLANLPSTRNREMPSLYVNTVFYDHQLRANWPAKVVKEDRGAWSASPTATYSGEAGNYVPDGTLPEGSMYAIGIDVADGQEIPEPYHYRSIPFAVFLRYRMMTDLYGSLTDAELLGKMRDEWHEEVDWETSRVWKGNTLWECLVDGTTQEPWFTSPDWKVVTIAEVSLKITSTKRFMKRSDFVPATRVATTFGFVLSFGNYNATDYITQPMAVWTRQSIGADREAATGTTARTLHEADEIWNQAHRNGNLTLPITAEDLPSNWNQAKEVQFTLTVTNDWFQGSTPITIH